MKENEVKHIHRPYSEMLFDLGKLQVELFHENNEAYMSCLVTCDSTREVMHEVYNMLVRKDFIDPVEKLTTDEKQNLWTLTKEYAAGRIDKARMVMLSKSLIALEYLLN